MSEIKKIHNDNDNNNESSPRTPRGQDIETSERPPCIKTQRDKSQENARVKKETDYGSFPSHNIVK
jgi:hypothetical protein